MTVIEVINSTTFNNVALFVLGAVLTNYKQGKKKREEDAQNKIKEQRNIIEEQGKLKAADARLWEKLIMLRKVAEKSGWTIPDTDWERRPLPSDDSSNLPNP